MFAVSALSVRRCRKFVYVVGFVGCSVSCVRFCDSTLSACSGFVVPSPGDVWSFSRLFDHIGSRATHTTIHTARSHVLVVDYAGGRTQSPLVCDQDQGRTHHGLLVCFYFCCHKLFRSPFSRRSVLLSACCRFAFDTQNLCLRFILVRLALHAHNDLLVTLSWDQCTSRLDAFLVNRQSRSVCRLCSVCGL